MATFPLCTCTGPAVGGKASSAEELAAALAWLKDAGDKNEGRVLNGKPDPQQSCVVPTEDHGRGARIPFIQTSHPFPSTGGVECRPNRHNHTKPVHQLSSL